MSTSFLVLATKCYLSKFDLSKFETGNVFFNFLCNIFRHWSQNIASSMCIQSLLQRVELGQFHNVLSNKIKIFEEEFQSVSEKILNIKNSNVKINK